MSLIPETTLSTATYSELGILDPSGITDWLNMEIQPEVKALVTEVNKRIADLEVPGFLGIGIMGSHVGKFGLRKAYGLEKPWTKDFDYMIIVDTDSMCAQLDEFCELMAREDIAPNVEATAISERGAALLVRHEMAKALADTASEAINQALEDLGINPEQFQFDHTQKVPYCDLGKLSASGLTSHVKAIAENDSLFSSLTLYPVLHAIGTDIPKQLLDYINTQPHPLKVLTAILSAGLLPARKHIIGSTTELEKLEALANSRAAEIARNLLAS